MPQMDEKRPLQGLVDQFLCSMVDARGALDQVEATFSNCVWPAICDALKKGAAEISELQHMNDELRAQVEVERALKNLRKPISQAAVKVQHGARLATFQHAGPQDIATKPQNPSVTADPSHMRGRRTPLADVTNQQKHLKSAGVGWRHTHESFLDTPREEVLAKISAATILGRKPAYATVPRKVTTSIVPTMECSSGFISPRAQAVEISNQSSSSKKGHGAPPFKYTEVVRIKRERETLLATECKQCKQFYDALESGDAKGVHIARCDHLKISSRHRYKNLPPDTPLGFWNLGFPDTE